MIVKKITLLSTLNRVIRIVFNSIAISFGEITYIKFGLILGTKISNRNLAITYSTNKPITVIIKDIIVSSISEKY